jgi:hypothetical protein
MTISAAQARIITADIMEAVTPVLEKHGLAVTKRSSNYGPWYAIKISADTPNVDTETGIDLNSEYAREFNMLRRSLGFPLEGAAPLGVSIFMRGEQWTFLGYNSRASKLPWMFTRVRDGKVFKFPTEPCRALLLERVGLK